MDDRIVLSLLVDNTAGVLARVAGLFSRRGYNIESLTVGVTADPRYSRMTVVSLGDQTVLEHIPFTSISGNRGVYRTDETPSLECRIDFQREFYQNLFGC